MVQIIGQAIHALGIAGSLDEQLAGLGSGAGYASLAHVLPLILMLAGGGRALEDLRILRRDDGLRQLLGLNKLPSSDATGDWLRRMGSLAADNHHGLAGVNAKLIAHLLRADPHQSYTLDIDATQIVAEKRAAHYTYKGERAICRLSGILRPAVW